LLGLGFRCVLVANDGAQSEFGHSSQHHGSKIRTAWVVAETLSEQFFAPARSREARLNRHQRNGELPYGNTYTI
jgi:hypothetical protein